MKDVRQGKYFELDIDAPAPEDARQLAAEAADKLLSNPVIESYRIEIVDEVTRMKFAVVVFPGSNCDHDALLRRRSTCSASRPSSSGTRTRASSGADVVILPGGFAHGDYLRTGAIARFSPIMAEVQRFADAGGPVLGICNGFQVLLEAGLLPGAMLRNRSVKFQCEHVHRQGRADRHAVHAAPAGRARCCGSRSRTARATTTRSRTSSRGSSRIARSSSATSTPTASATDEANPNGSVANIAGLCNEARNVVGLMPHPERACELALGSADGLDAVRVRRAGRERSGRSVRRPSTMTHRPPTLLERHGLTPRGIPAHRRRARARADADRARHLLGDVVGALQLQELARAPEDAADRPASACCRARARTPAPSTSATASRAVFKIESHNHPSFIEPYQGAATGVGGIIRDIFTMGARPIALLNSLRFGSLDDPLVRRTFAGVVAGIARLRQQHRHPDRRRRDRVRRELHRQSARQRVLPRHRQRTTRSSRASRRAPATPVYYVGAKTGRDGIHGATMASAEFDDKSAEKRPAVQVGDPFMEKLLLEACLEVMKTDALVGIQDMGAAGLTCSTCEMGSRGGAGVEIDVSLVPQRETGMTPYEIMLSESQERMLLVVKRGREAEVERIFEKWDLHAVRIGEVTTDGMLRVKNRGEVVAEIPNTRADRRGAAVSAADGGAGVPRGGAAAVARRRSASRAAPRDAFTRLLRVADDREQALGLSAVRPHGAHQHARAAGHGRRRRARQGHATRAGDVGRLQRPLRLPRSVSPARSWRWPKRRATSPAPAALPIGATNCLNFGNPERPEIMWQFAQRGRGHGRGVPRARHSDHRRQRQPLQRDRRPRRCCRRRSSASSA